jgi:hypothetical protein
MIVVTGGVLVHHLTSYVSHLLLAKRRHILSLESSCNVIKQTRISFRYRQKKQLLGIYKQENDQKDRLR